MNNKYVTNTQLEKQIRNVTRKNNFNGKEDTFEKCFSKLIIPNAGQHGCQEHILVQTFRGLLALCFKKKT
jgi:hypothetical protein